MQPLSVSNMPKALKEISVSTEVKALCHKNVKAVDAEYTTSGKYGQDKNAIAAQRTIKELLNGKAWPDKAKDPAGYAKLQQALKFFGNASAVRQNVLESKTETPAAEISADALAD